MVLGSIQLNNENHCGQFGQNSKNIITSLTLINHVIPHPKRRLMGKLKQEKKRLLGMSLMFSVSDYPYPSLSILLREN
jgi:hypothetical protein